MEHVIELFNAEAVAKKAAKEAQAALDIATLKKYGDLTEDEVKALVLDDKWQATVVEPRSTSEVNVLTLDLVAASSSSASATPRPSATSTRSLASSRAKVAAHLADMGVK